MKATLYKTTGEVIEVSPKNRKYFVYDEMTKFVGGMVEFVPTPDGKYQFICNEEGRLGGYELNVKASKLWLEHYPLEHYSLNNAGYLMGDVLFCPEELLEQDN